MKAIILIILMMISISSFALSDHQTHITIEMKQAEVQDILREFADILKLNIILSPNIKAITTVQFHDVIAEDAMQSLIIANGLAKWDDGGVIFIAPRDELLKLREDEIKRSEIELAASDVDSHLWQIRYAKAESIYHAIKNEQVNFLSKRGQLSLDARTNTILARDVKTQLNEIDHFIKQWDIPLKQLQVSARLVAVDSDSERELGLQFDTLAKQSSEKSATAHGRFPLAIARLSGNSLLDIKLLALEHAGHAELISSPSLFTTDQQPASIEAGEEVPYQELSDRGGTVVVFKKAVLSLKVIPQVLPNHKIMLQLQINQDKPSTNTVLGVPTISTHQINTNVLLADGETVVLGGIYEEKRERTKQGLPWLLNAPVIGWVFKSENARDNRRQLLIFVTPRIIK